MDDLLNVVLIGSSGVVYDGPADSVTAPGVDGNFGILHHHAPLISAILTGLLTVKVHGDAHVYLVGKGYLEVCDNRVVLLVSEIRELDSVEIGRRLLKEDNPWEAADLLEAESMLH